MRCAAPPFTKPVIGTIVALFFGVAAATARADTLSELKAQIDALQKKVEQLEQAQAQAAKAVPAPPAPPPAQAVTAGATKGSIKLPGSDTSITLGGYLKLDAIYSDRSAGTASQGNQFLFPSLIPVGPTAGNNVKNQLTVHARQSRLFFRSSTPSSYGEITTLVEGDFFGADGNETVSNSHNFRLRHAYGSIGNFSAGQFWSNFINEAAYPETLDFGGPVGEIFIRQAQLRWTQPFAGGDWSVSAENPESIFAQPRTATLFRSDRDLHPDFTGRIRFNTGYGKYSLQVLARNIRIDSAAAPAAVGDKWGGAISATGVIPTVGKDDFRFVGNFGNVIGRYQELGFFPDGFLDASGQIKLANVVSGYAAYRHYWTPSLRSSLVLSAARASNPSGTFGLINRRSESAHLNLIWSPTTPVNLGAEYVFGKRVVEDGRNGNLNRFQISAQYGF